MANLEHSFDQNEAWTRIQELKIGVDEITMEEINSLRQKVEDALKGGTLTSIGLEKIKNTLRDLDEILSVTWLSEEGVIATELALTELTYITTKLSKGLTSQEILSLKTFAMDLQRIESNGFINKETIEKIEVLAEIISNMLEDDTHLDENIPPSLERAHKSLATLTSDEGVFKSILKDENPELCSSLKIALKSFVRSSGHYSELEFRNLKILRQQLTKLKEGNSLSPIDQNYIELLENHITDILDPALSDQSRFSEKDLNLLEQTRLKILRKSNEEREAMRNKIVKEGFDFFYDIEEGAYISSIEDLDKDRDKIKRYLMAIYQYMKQVKQKQGQDLDEEKYKNGILSFGRWLMRTLIRQTLYKEVKEKMIEPFLQTSGNKQRTNLNTAYLSALAALERLYFELYKSRKSALGSNEDSEVQKNTILKAEFTQLKAEAIETFNKIYNKLGYRFSIQAEELNSFDEFLNQLGANSGKFNLTDHDRKTLAKAVIACTEIKKLEDGSANVDATGIYEGLI
ncbi:hypothetical protein GF354_02340 [Candidatus Peregrinibacteria bacterium]|nr:hypothetical protein [Candidatus Peregrinibacteria bacterium]